MIIKIIIIIIIGFILYNIFKNKTEKLENENPKKRELAEKILNAFTDKLSYSEYLNIINENNNLSYELIKQETFFELKFFLKNNQLSIDKIIQYMSDVN